MNFCTLYNICKILSEEQAKLNVVIVHSSKKNEDQIKCNCGQSLKFANINNYFFKIESDMNCDPNEMYLNTLHRNFLKLKLNDKIELKSFNVDIDDRKLDIQIKIFKYPYGKKELVLLKHNELLELVKKCLFHQIIQINMEFLLVIDNVGFIIKIIKTNNTTIYCKNDININIEIDDFCQCYLQITDKQIQPIISNWDLQSLGIGGLEKEFNMIFRRTFASRAYPPDYIEKMGVKHVKGIILHGPPGTGKTLIARQLSKILNCVEPKIINGPELLDKYIGESERKVRELFFEAEKEFEMKNNYSRLHVIILDEMDAICKSRSKNDNLGVNSNIVNQFLSKMDGIKSLNNILLIGMTNRLELIDSALLRPGRFELTLEISLPDQNGRLEILLIHTKKMKDNNNLDKSVDLVELSKLTKNYTGAELEGLIKIASSYVLDENIDKKNLENNISNIIIRQEHFVKAMEEIKPIFGSNFDKIDYLIPNNILFYQNKNNETWQNFISKTDEMVTKTINNPYVNSRKISINGKQGSGKTTLAAIIAKKINLPFCEIIDNYNFIGLHELDKANKLKEIFINSYKSDQSLIIIDNIENILDYSNINNCIRFSNILLNTLKSLFTKTNKNKLFLIITCDQLEIIQNLELENFIDTSYQIELVNGTETIKEHLYNNLI
ncbi:AAA family ATPase [uncultured virus]|nr:AAA family ATPase [uncultured virus]